MFGTPVQEGTLFYGETRRRQPVAFDADLRGLTARVAAEARANLLAGRTPPPVLKPGCRRCSLAGLCQPARMQQPPAVQRWLAGQLEG